MLKLKLQYFGHDVKSESLEKTLMFGKFEGSEEKEKTEDEMVELHRLNGHEFEQALGDSEGQGNLVCVSPRGCKELDVTWVTEQQVCGR